MAIQNDANKSENDWNPGKLLLIWEHSVRAIHWIPTWQGLDGFQKVLHPCALDKSNLSIPMLRPLLPKAQGHKYFWKPFKPCHDGIHWKALAEFSQMRPMCQGFSDFSGLLHHFVSAKLATNSIRVKYASRNCHLEINYFCQVFWNKEYFLKNEKVCQNN